MRHGRRRRLSIVHLPTHLALQAAAEARARQARKRRVDAHAVQRFSVHARVVAHREREDRLQQHRDAARQEAITRSRTLGDRPEVTRVTKVRVHAVPAIVKTPKERVIHSHRLHDHARAVGRTVRLVRVRHVDRSSARRRRARCDARAVDDSFIPQVASEAGSSAARRLDFDESRPTDESPPHTSVGPDSSACVRPRLGTTMDRFRRRHRSGERPHTRARAHSRRTASTNARDRFRRTRSRRRHRARPVDRTRARGFVGSRRESRIGGIRAREASKRAREASVRRRCARAHFRSSIRRRLARVSRSNARRSSTIRFDSIRSRRVWLADRAREERSLRRTPHHSTVLLKEISRPIAKDAKDATVVDRIVVCTRDGIRRRRAAGRGTRTPTPPRGDGGARARSLDC